MIVEFLEDVKHYRGKNYHKQGSVKMIKDSFAKKCIEEGKAIKRDSLKPNFLEEAKNEGLEKLKKKVKEKKNSK